MSKSMNTRTRYASIAALALAAGLAGAAYAGSDQDKDADRRTGSAATAGASSPQLALDDVLARLRSAGYSDFREIEREKGRYEVKGSDAEGRRVELYVDARTGEVVKEACDD